jgi:hypothetical protein
MRIVRRRGYHPGGRSLFKGDSPHSRPQASRAKSSPTRSKVLPLRHGGLGPTRHASWPGTEEAKPPRAVRVTAQRLQALLHLRLNHRVKGWAAIQAACNCTTGMHPFDFDASSMAAQAHTSCKPARRLLRVKNSTATSANAAPPRLRNRCRDSRKPCA